MAEREAAAHMLREMGELQDAHNREVAEDWRTRGFEYYRAIWVECAELLDHYGWKWWKHQEPDLEQVRLELVDIWHFGLSILLRDGGFDDALTEVFVAEADRERDASQLREDVEALAESSLRDHGFDVSAFIRCMNSLGMSLEQLYREYIGKNVLNNFRQHHGYADGSYRKLWGGREDNEHLMELLGALDATSHDFPATLYQALEDRYRATA